MRYVFLLTLIMFVSGCVHYGFDQKEAFLKMAKCETNCNVTNPIKEKLLGKWMVHSKAKALGIEFDPSALSVTWDFKKNGLKYLCVADKEILNGFFKIVDTEILKIGAENYKYKISEDAFEMVGIDKLNPMILTGVRIKTQ